MQTSKLSAKDAAILILQQAGGPLHYKAITKKVLAEGLWSTNGKTPEATLGRDIGRDINKHGSNSRFIKTAPGTFALNNKRVKKSDSPAKPKPAQKTKPPQKTPRNPKYLSFLDAAAKVLDEFGNRHPMHYRDITQIALKHNWLNTSGKTPEATMNAQLVTNIKRMRAAGEPGKFVRSSPGYYGLVKWMGTGIPLRISEHNRKIRQKLLAELLKLEPGQFEELVSQLLAEMSFESIEVTKLRADGGIDVRGTMLISNSIRIKMAVQAKRWKNNVQSPTVQQVRGSLGVHEQGLIISTGGFSKGAKSEAKQPHKTPVGLMDGAELVSLLQEYKIGVSSSSYEIFELCELQFSVKD